jgi:polyhydroxyalkanoate synthase
VIDPAVLKMECFVAVPKGDRIVPVSCAQPLTKLLRKVTLVEPSSGHVGMMVGSRRKVSLWEPFADWAES